jgi:hypothetical protein
VCIQYFTLLYPFFISSPLPQVPIP